MTRPRLVSTTILHGGVRCDPQPLSGIDVLTTHMGIPIFQVYPQGLDIDVVRQALVATLARYPLLSGRMKKDAQGLPFIDGCDAGMPFRVHDCAAPLPAYGPGHTLPLKALHTPLYPWQVFRPDTALSGVDIYRFEGGGMVLSITTAHSVMDGTAFWQFMQDWAAAARGQDVPERPMERRTLIELGQANLQTPYSRGYVYEMGRWEQMKLFARLAWQHVFSMDKAIFRIPASTLAQWKAEARAALPEGDGVTTAELVTAHCLQVLSPSWPMQRDRCLGLVLDLRYRRRLRVPRHYLGNALGHGEVSYSAQELCSEPLATLALKSRLPADALTHEDLLGYLGMMERARQNRTTGRLMMRSVVRTLDAGFVLNNLSHYPMYEIDFGTGRPAWHDAKPVVFHMVKIHPTPEMDGGVDVHVVATRRQLEAFRRLHG